MALGKNLRKSKLIPQKGELSTDIPQKEASVQSAPVGEAAVPSAVPGSVASGKSIDNQEYEVRKEIHERFHKEIESLTGKEVHVISFVLAGELYAIDINSVNEVVHTPPINAMPQAPAYVPGIATIRGKSIVILDIALKLGIVDNVSYKSRGQYTIVISTGKYTVGLLVPEVPNNIKVKGSQLQATSDNLGEMAREETYVKALIRDGSKVTYLLDVQELIEGDRLKSRVVRNG